MIWLRVAQGVLCAVEICGLYYLLQVFFDKRSNKAWSNILWFLSGVLLWGITVIQREGTSMYSRYYMIFCIIISLWGTKIFFRLFFFRALLVIVLYYETIYFIDILFGYIGQSLFSGNNFIDRVQFSISVERIMVMLISRLLVVSIVIYTIKRKHLISTIFPKYQLTFTGFVIIEYLGLFYCENVFYPRFRDDVKTDMYFVLFPMLIVLILIIIVIFIMYTEKMNELKLINNQNTMIEKNYQDMCLLYQKRDRIYHDMKNHLSVLSLLLADRDLVRAEEYISKITEPIKDLEHKKFTNNHIVDIILNDKIEKAHNHNIEIDIHTDKLEVNCIQDIDWCSILANLLDNAIEACSKVTEGKSWIKVSISQNDCAIFIKVSNTYNGVLDLSEGKLRSSKNETGLHGLGLESIRYAVDKYNGVLEYECVKDIFIVNISLFI